MEEMLKNLDSIEIPQANAEEKPVEEAEETPEQSAEEAALDLDHVLQNDMTVGSVLEQEHREENKGAEKRMDVKTASDENAIITAGMVITGDVSSEGSMDLVGTINGNIDILNVKCDPELVGMIIQTYGFLPGYHMNKRHWLTILLDGSVSEAKTLDFLDMSYDLIDGGK